ncbi:MAG: AsmA-like C-terminal region-containing protein [Lentisphaeria bacterium]|nr:AsmA-like C-terminal region-containing protein [Lentisphaeria bacterium]
MTRKKKTALGVLVISASLAITAWFVVTSEFFIKKAVFPRVAASLGAELDAETVSLRPFSSLELTRLTVKREGKLDVKIGHMRVNYSLMSLLKKSPVVSECLIENGDIVIRLAAPAPGVEAPEPASRVPETSPRKSSPPSLDIRNISLKNIAVTIFPPGETEKNIHIDNLSVHIPMIKNGEILNLKTTFAILSAALPDGDMSAELVTVTSAIRLSAELFPESVDTQLTIENVEGVYCHPTDIRVAARASVTSPTRITLDRLAGSVGPAGEAALCSLEGKGSVNTEADDFQYMLSLSSPEVINADALRQLFTVETSEPTNGQPPEPPEKEPEADIPLPAIPPGIAAKVDIALPGITYQTYHVKNITIQATLKDSVLTIPAASCVTFDTPVNLVATWDGGDPGDHHVTSAVTLGKTPAGKILSTLRPAFPVVFNGGFESLSLHASTRGTLVSHLLDNLTGESQFQISSLTVESMPSWADQLTRGVLRLFSLSRDDLSFHGGAGTLALSQGVVDVRDVFLDAALWRLNLIGKVPLEGAPDLTFTPAFRGTSARKLADQGIRLDKESEGFQPAPPLQLKGDIWNSRKALTAVPLLVMNYSAALRADSAELKAVNDGVTILKDIMDKPDTITKEPGKILQGAYGIYRDIEKQKDEDDAAKGKETDPPKPEEHLIDSLLKGVLGK